MLAHKQLRAKALDNPDVKSEFEALGDEYALLDEFLKARSTTNSPVRSSSRTARAAEL